MTKETMTIHKALAELKVLDDRITSEIDDAVFITNNKHSNTKIDGMTINDFQKAMTSQYQKINDLITRRNAIKRAVNASNAITEVEIAGTKYTVALAIEMKNHGIELQKILLNEMKKQNDKVTRSTQKSNDELPNQADKYVTGIYGGRESKIDSKVINDTRNTYIEANTVDILNPLNIKDEISKLKDKIDAFDAEVDAALSCSNAITKINIEY